MYKPETVKCLVMAETAIKTVTEAFNNDRRIGDPTIGRIEPKDFFWDQFIKYISSAILALTIINFSIDFLQGGGVVCFPPSDTAALVLMEDELYAFNRDCLLYTSPSPRDATLSRMPSSA